eukprot:6438391-Karenia_brevis.AAC.1
MLAGHASSASFDNSAAIADSDLLAMHIPPMPAPPPSTPFGLGPAPGLPTPPLTSGLASGAKQAA